MHFVVDWYYRYRYMQCVNARVDFINLLVVGTRNRVLAARRCLSARKQRYLIVSYLGHQACTYHSGVT